MTMDCGGLRKMNWSWSIFDHSKHHRHTRPSTSASHIPAPSIPAISVRQPGFEDDPAHAHPPLPREDVPSPAHPPYTCLLSPRALNKARDELREVPEEREAKIQELRHWIETNEDIVCRTDSEFLLRFLRVAKFQVQSAKDRLTRFCVVRSSPSEGVADWFPNDRFDPIARQVLATGFFIPLPKRDPKGRRIILIKADRLNFRLHGPEAILRGGLLAADHIISESEEDNIHGYVLLHDMSNVGMEHVLPWNKATIKRCMKCWQDVYPFRMKEYNIMTSSVVIKTLLNFAKKLLKAKYKNRIFVYSDLDSLYATVPKEILPQEYGGQEVSIPTLIDRLGHNIDANEAEFDLLQDCRIRTAFDKSPRRTDSTIDAESTGDALLSVHEEHLKRSTSAPDFGMNGLNLAQF